MATWLYQMSAQEWPPARYREEIWEGDTVNWPIGRITGKPAPSEGDKMIAWYTKSGAEPGIYGWGVIVRKTDEFNRIRWRPVFPSDYLKMSPLFDEAVAGVIDAVRKKMPRGTMWLLTRDQEELIRKEISDYLS